MTYPGLIMNGFKYSNFCMSRYAGIMCTAKTPDVQSRRPAFLTAVFTVSMSLHGNYKSFTPASVAA